MCAKILRMRIDGLIKKAEKFGQARVEGNNSAAAQEMQVLMKLGKLCQKKAHTKIPYIKDIGTEAYRAAGELGSKDALYEFGFAKVDAGKFWATWSLKPFATEIHKQYMQKCFEEGFAALNQAVKLGHFMAKRYLGKCYLHGWGVNQDEIQGARFYISSFQEEGSKAWKNAGRTIANDGFVQTHLLALLADHQHEKREQQEFNKENDV